MEIGRIWLSPRSDAHILEDGFGMIEVVISLFLLSLLSVSFIPLLVNSIKSTGKNATIATATQIVNQEIEGARAVRSPTSTTPSCLDITSFLNVTLASVTDPRGVTLLPKWDPPSCPASYPGVVRARVSVTRSGSTITMAQAVTLIYVASAT
jgi:type II secretory pathway pseudopilin PulG